MRRQGTAAFLGFAVRSRNALTVEMTVMNASPVSRVAAAAQSARRVQDEWGVYNPHEAGMPALMRALDHEEPATPVMTNSIPNPASTPLQPARREESHGADVTPDHGAAA